MKDIYSQNINRTTNRILNMKAARELKLKEKNQKHKNIIANICQDHPFMNKVINFNSLYFIS